MCSDCQGGSQQGQDEGLSLHDLARSVMEMHSGLSRLVDVQRRQFPVIVNESGYDASGSNKTLTLRAQSRNRVKITALVVNSSASAATVVLGSVTIPVPAGLTNLHGLSILLDYEDVRTLTATSAGTLQMLLCGEDLMNYLETH